MKFAIFLCLAIAVFGVNGVLAQTSNGATKPGKGEAADQLEGMIYLSMTANPLTGASGPTTLGIAGYEIKLSQQTKVPSNWNLQTGEVYIGGTVKFRVRGKIINKTIVAAEITQLEPSPEPVSPDGPSR